MSAFGQGRALVIGLTDYHAMPSLPDAIRNDAAALRQMLVSPRCRCPEDRVTSLIDAQATRAAILDTLDQLARDATDQDTVLVYFAGHGGRLAGSADACFLVHDTAPADLAGTAIAASTLVEKLAAIGARRLLVFLDGCHAAGAAVSQALPAFTPGLEHEALAPLLAREGRAIVSSSKATELSLVPDGDTHSLFAKHLLRGLLGESAVGGLVTFGRLADHVAARVSAGARTLGQAQTVLYDMPMSMRLLVLAYASPDAASSTMQAMTLPSPARLRQRIVDSVPDRAALARFVGELSDLIGASGYTQAGQPLVLSIDALGGPETPISDLAQSLVDRLRTPRLLEYLVLAVEERRMPRARRGTI
ncbi:MAG TPA: caspase family protein [Kofleriaceae bacterium]|nr:caspase family protein [Kofleriaceae bacterium]